MADDVVKPVELGFAEFVAKLISDVFDATLGAQAEQNEKLAELESLLQESEVVFVDSLLAKPEFISEIDKLLFSYFPAENGNDHIIQVGAKYQAATRNTAELPALKETIGYEVKKGDIVAREKILTEQAVANIYRHLALPSALKKRDILLKMVENGLPNIVVDKGKINAKLTFNTSLIESTLEQDDGLEEKENTTDSLNARLFARESVSSTTLIQPRNLAFTNRVVSPIDPIDRFVGLIKPNVKDQVRLTVKQASNKSPQDTQATTNIFSEVEIHFKTIS